MYVNPQENHAQNVTLGDERKSDFLSDRSITHDESHDAATDFFKARGAEGHKARKRSCRPARIDQVATWNVEGISLSDNTKLK